MCEFDVLQENLRESGGGVCGNVARYAVALAYVIVLVPRRLSAVSKLLFTRSRGPAGASDSLTLFNHQHHSKCGSWSPEFSANV